MLPCSLCPRDPTMPIQLPIAEYRFTCRAVDPVELPAFADPLFYSVFGLALKHLSCIGEQQSCHDCQLRFQCDFALLLRGIIPADNKSEIAGKMRNVPPPLVFHSRLRGCEIRIPAGSFFPLSLVLVGHANTKTVAVIRAMIRAGELGIGSRRARFTLVETARTGPEGLERLVMADGEIMAPGLPLPVRIPEAPSRVRVSFLTPWLLPDTRGVLEDGFNGGKMIGRVVRRISLMHEPYTGAALEADFKQLAALYGTSLLLDGDIHAQKNYRYSSGKKRFLAISGWFDMDLEGRQELWPYFFLGQWLHVPKIAAKGFGRYRLQAVD